MLSLIQEQLGGGLKKVTQVDVSSDGIYQIEEMNQELRMVHTQMNEGETLKAAFEILTRLKNNLQSKVSDGEKLEPVIVDSNVNPDSKDNVTSEPDNEPFDKSFDQQVC